MNTKQEQSEKRGLTPEQEQRYRELYANLGLDPADFGNLDANTRRVRVKEAMEKEFCLGLFGDCKKPWLTPENICTECYKG